MVFDSNWHFKEKEGTLPDLNLQWQHLVRMEDMGGDFPAKPNTSNKEMDGAIASFVTFCWGVIQSQSS